MIEKMHDKTNSFAFKAIFALVAVSFVLGGVGGSIMYSKDDYVAKVNGESITQQNFNYTKNRQQSIQSDKLGAKFWDLLDTPEYAAQFNKEILNSLIDEELLKQYIQTLKLGVSADQIKQRIVNTPDFQKDGKFNNDFYQNVLRNNNISPDYYASMVARDILNEQVQQGILGSQFSVPAENKLLAKLLLQQRFVKTTVLSLAKEVENQTASDEELKTYFEQNKAQFIEPEKMQVEIVTITPEDLANANEVKDQDIEEYYQQNRDKFITKGEKHLAHIQLTDQKTAKEVEKKLEAGEDFSKLAKTYSQDKLSGQKGGDLGWIKVGMFPEVFEQVANVVKKGQFSKAFEVNGNFHIIKVLDRKDDVALTFDQAKAKIKQDLIKKHSLEAYGKVSNEMANKAFESPDSLIDVAKVANKEVYRTAEFSFNKMPKEVAHPKIQSALVKGDFRRTHQVSEAIDLTEGNKAKTAFIRVINYKESRPQTFDEAKLNVDKIVKLTKARKVLSEKASQVLVKLNNDEKTDIIFGEEQKLVYIQNLMKQPTLTKDIFAMPKPKGKTTYQVTYDKVGNAVIIALNNVVDGNVEDFTILKNALSQANLMQLNEEVLRDLRERATLEYNDAYLRQQEP